MCYNEDMNQGPFNKNCELLLIHIENMNNGKMKKCNATTTYLAKAIGKSERQTYRYLTHLQKNGLIVRETSKLSRDKKRNNLYKLRSIKTTEKVEKHPQKYDILSLTFNKELHGRVRNRMTKEVTNGAFSTPNLGSKPKTVKIEAMSFAPANFTVEKVAEVVKNTTYIAYLPPVEIKEVKDNMTIYEENMKKIEEEKKNSTFRKSLAEKGMEFKEYKKEDFISKEELERLDAEQIFNSNRDKEAEKILIDKNLGKLASKGENVEILVKHTIDNYRAIYARLEEFCPEEDFEIRDRMEMFAQNSIFENGKYMYTLNLGRSLSYKLDIFDYVPWSKDHKNFEIYLAFMKEMGKI